MTPIRAAYLAGLCAGFVLGVLFVLLIRGTA